MLNKVFITKICSYQLISDTLLIEQLIYLTDFWNWAVEKRLASSQPRFASV